MYYKVLMEGGHMGAGKSYDMIRYFRAESVNAIYEELRTLPRLKSKGSGRSVKLIEPVSREEFLAGRQREEKDRYLRRHA